MNRLVDDLVKVGNCPFSLSDIDNEGFTFVPTEIYYELLDSEGNSTLAEKLEGNTKFKIPVERLLIYLHGKHARDTERKRIYRCRSCNEDSCTEYVVSKFLRVRFCGKCAYLLSWLVASTDP